MAALPNAISTKGKKIVSVFISQSKRLISFHQQFCEFLVSFFAKHNAFKVSPNNKMLDQNNFIDDPCAYIFHVKNSLYLENTSF